MTLTPDERLVLKQAVNKARRVYIRRIEAMEQREAHLERQREYDRTKRKGKALAAQA